MMGNYEQLISAITAVVKTNNNQEITGALLQQVLRSMVSQIGAGATFAGIATPSTNPSTPDQNVFYLAGDAGTYSNFGGYVLVPNNIAVFCNSTGSWVGSSIQTVSLVNDLTTGGADKALSAEQGKVLAQQSNAIENEAQAGLQFFGIKNCIHVPYGIYSTYYVIDSNKYEGIVLRVNGGDTFKIKRGADNIYIAFLKDFDFQTPYYGQAVTNLCEDTSTIFINTGASTFTYTLPSDCKFVFVTTKFANTNRTPSLIELNNIDILDGIQSDISDIQSDITDIQSDVTDIQSDVTDVQSDITDIQAVLVAKNSTNIIDWDNISIIDGKYYKGSNGILAIGTSDHKALPLIKIKPNTTYCLSGIRGGVVSGLGNSTEVATCFYNSSKTFISSVDGALITFTTPATAAYIGISLYKYGNVTYPCFQSGSARNYTPYNPISGYIDNDVITEDETVFFDRTKNLFDYTKAITGYYINTNGVQSESASWSASDYIPVEPSKGYVTSNNYGSGGAANAFYTAGMEFISYFKSVPVAIPSNAAYVRFSINGTSETTLKAVQVEYGQENTSFEPYGYKLKTKYLTDVEMQAISMPKKIYILSDVNNDIFYEPIVKMWNPYKYDVKVTTNVYRDYVKAIKRVCTLNNPTATTISFSIYDAEKEQYIVNKTCDIVQGTRAVGSNTVKIGIIGDSYTDGGCFTPALLSNGHVPNLQMVGTRSVNATSYISQRLDGRAGWTLRNFCNVQTGADYFNPFYHPQGSHRYWGNTAFWANVCGGNPSGYGTRYTHYASLCDSSGFPVSPTDGDVIYDSTNSVFKEYQSGSWTQVATTVAAVKEYYTWEFNYQKYLSMWSVDTADIFCVDLGVNDYWVSNEPTDESLAEWKTLMDAIITSYHSVNATGKFVILCTNTVTNPNVNNYQPLDVHRRMWKLRDFIIKNYDQREAELIYVVDTAHLIDSENSFTLQETTPFDGYPNGWGYSNKEIWAGDGQHPRVSYTTLGYSLAAFIQYHRS